MQGQYVGNQGSIPHVFLEPRHGNINYIMNGTDETYYHTTVLYTLFLHALA